MAFMMGCCATGPAVQAADIFVGSVPPGESGTSVTSIQAAVSVVQPGDTIYLRAGNYHEAVNMRNLPGTAAQPIKIHQLER